MKFRMTKPAFLPTDGATTPRQIDAGEVVTLHVPPPISAVPLDQEAIDAFQAHHGNRRQRPNGLQVYDVETGRTRVPVAGGGMKE